MNKKAYFFVNGILLSKDNPLINEVDKIDLDDKYLYGVWNFGVDTDLKNCKYGALKDLTTTSIDYQNIIPNSYVSIFEIELEEEDYKNIIKNGNSKLEIFEKITNNKNKLIYSGMYDNNCNFIENFVDNDKFYKKSGISLT